MPATLETLSHDALGLAPDQRVTLAHLLLESVEPEPDPEIEAAWAKEIARRVARLDAGEATLVPAEEVHAELRRGVANDETAYLMSSPANVKRLLESIQALENGQGVVRDVDLGAGV